MNKKAITDFISTLILGSIAVSVIFIGVFYSYKTLACYLGTDLSQVSLKVGNPGRFNEQSLSLNVSSKEINLSYCNNTCLLNNYDKYCSDKNSEDCLINCSNLYEGNKSSYDSSCPDNCNNNDCLTYCTTKSCISSCEDAYKDSSKLNYFFNVTYKGATPTAIGIAVNEIKGGSNIPILIYSDETKDPLRYGDNYVFNKNFTKHENCKSEMVIKLIPKEESSSVRELTKTFENDFCLTIPEKKVNVSVHDFSYGSNSLSVTAAIDGEDVSTLCPDALFSFTLYNKTSNSEEVPINGSGQSCQFMLSTNRSKMPNGWFNDLEYNYRVRINVNNPLYNSAFRPMPTYENEPALVNIIFPENVCIPNCDYLLLTDANSQILSSWAFRDFGYRKDGCCGSVSIEFVTNSSFFGSKIFFAYFGKNVLPDGFDTNSYVKGEDPFKYRHVMILGKSDPPFMTGRSEILGSMPNKEVYKFNNQSLNFDYNYLSVSEGYLRLAYQDNNLPIYGYYGTGGYFTNIFPFSGPGSRTNDTRAFLIYFDYPSINGQPVPFVSPNDCEHLSGNLIDVNNYDMFTGYLVNTSDSNSTHACNVSKFDFLVELSVIPYYWDGYHYIPDQFDRSFLTLVSYSNKSISPGLYYYGPIRYAYLDFDLFMHTSRVDISPVVTSIIVIDEPRLSGQSMGIEGICSPLTQTLTCSNIKNFNAANNCGLTNTSKVMGVLWTDKYSELLDWMNDNQETLDNVGCIS